MRVTVVSPWYPHRSAVYSGVFVEKGNRAIENLGAQVEVEVPTIFPAPAGEMPGNVRSSMDHLASVDPHLLYESRDGAVWIPAPVPARSGQMGRARAFAEALQRKRTHLPASGDITHAHLGVPTGWAVVRLGDSPLVVTEHQSTLGQILDHEESRNAYRKTLEAADAFICVSTVLKNQLVDTFGDLASDKVEVIPNVVDLGGIEFTARDHFPFRSWIYVGGLTPGKGIVKLVESFALYRKYHEAEAKLTLVGDGPLREWVTRYAAREGIGDAISMPGARPHDEIGRFYAEADVMVHLSEFETFGIACLEAIGAGLPVVSLRNGGAESTWGDYEDRCGLLADRDIKPAELVAEIVGLRESPQRLDPAAGREMVESRFSADRVGRALMEVYLRCLTN